MAKKIDLKALIAERIVSGLQRQAIVKPSKWAEKYRIMGGEDKGPWKFTNHPWLREMHDSEAQHNVGQKAAQMGFTEVVLNLTFFNIDIKAVDCLYVLPALHPDATNFSASRFDAALELSPHLANMFSDVKNVGHKRAGSANLFIRGSHARGALKSVPINFLVLDEVAEMVWENISLAEERTSGQAEWQQWSISTPTIEDHDINILFKPSTQDFFTFICPHCSKYIELTFPDSLIITAEEITDPNVYNSHLICTQCKGVLPHETKPEWLSTGIWVPKYPGRPVRGFSISQLYSCKRPASDIAIKAIKARSNPADETELYNSKLGVVHTVEGARVTDAEIKDAMVKGGHYNSDQPPQGQALITLGCDVGKVLHYEIDLWKLDPEKAALDINQGAFCKVLKQGTLKHFHELEDLMRQYHVLSAVIDAQPEKRLALDFARRFYGRVYVCFYTEGINGKTISVGKDMNEPAIRVDRTAWFDISLTRFKNGSIALPVDTTLEYKDHIKALTRVYGKDRQGNPVGRYITGENQPDHFGHARNYSEMALPFIGTGAGSQNVRVF